VVLAISSDAVAALVGAIVGAVITAGAGWVVAIGVERRRENLELLSALDVVASEIEENSCRLAKKEGLDALTYGVWHSVRPVIASRGRRAIDRPTYDELTAVYGLVYEARKREVQPGGDLAIRLSDVEEKLKSASLNFENEIGKLGYWLRPGKNLWRKREDAPGPSRGSESTG
jgi:hypothetical protein